MKVLIVTNLYPNAREPDRGIFNKQQFAELAKLCEVKIIAPIAWRPGRKECLQEGREGTGGVDGWNASSERVFCSTSGEGASRPSCEKIPEFSGIQVFYPHWLAIPKIGRSWHGRFYYWGIRKLFRQICAEWQPDVVLATWAYPDAYAVSMLLGSGGFIPPIVGGVKPPLPFVVKVHGTDINAVASASGPSTGSGCTGWQVRKLLATLERADAVVCVSKGLKARIRELIDHRHQTADHRLSAESGSASGGKTEDWERAEDGGQRTEVGRQESRERENATLRDCGFSTESGSARRGAQALGGQVSQFGNRQIAVITNGIDPDRFHPMDKHECRKQLGLALDKKHILFVGNLVPVKGVKYLIRAMDDLPDDVVLHIIGDGSLTKRTKVTKNKPATWNLQPATHGQRRILFHGRVPHEKIPIWMNAADVFCLPSLQEGCPNVIAESMACGTPVVASNVGGIPDLIDTESKGLTVPAGDPDAFSAGLRKILERDAYAAQTMSGRPRTWADTAREMHQILESAALR